MMNLQPNSLTLRFFAAIAAPTLALVLVALLFPAALSAQTMVDGVPLEAPEERIVDSEKIFEARELQVMREAIRELERQTEIQAWIATGTAETDMASLREASRRVHTWKDSGLGIVLFYPVIGNAAPHLAVSQDLLDVIPADELEKLRAAFRTTWDQQDGPLNSRVTASALQALEFPLLYKLETGRNVVEQRDYGINSREATDLNPAELRGSYRESWATEDEPENTTPTVSPPLNDDLPWRWQVIVINLAIFAVFVFAALWWYLYIRGLQQKREEAMKRGGEELSGNRRNTPSDANSGTTDDPDKFINDSESNRNRDVY